MGYPKIPDITCDDIAKIYNEQDRWRKESPCCQNCKAYYEEYGTEFCNKHDYPCEDTKEKCEDWT